MTENAPTTEVREIESRLRVLIVDVQPWRKQNVRISQELFGMDYDSVDKFANIAVTSVKTPKSDVEPSLSGKEAKTKLYLPSLDNFSAVVVTGSPFSVYPREQDRRLFLANWKKEVFTFIRLAHQKGIPFLGICWGGQALAEALGGKVQPMTNKGREVTERAWGVIRKAPGAVGDPLIGDLADEFVAPQNHEAIVAKLPEGSILLAENEYGVQGFRIGKAWGFEFHPERKAERVERFFSDAEVLKEMIDQGKNPESVRKLGERYDAGLRKIFANFLKFAWANRQ